MMTRALTRKGKIYILWNGICNTPMMTMTNENQFIHRAYRKAFRDHH